MDQINVYASCGSCNRLRRKSSGFCCNYYVLSKDEDYPTMSITSSTRRRCVLLLPPPPREWSAIIIITPPPADTRGCVCTLNMPGNTQNTHFKPKSRRHQQQPQPRTTTRCKLLPLSMHAPRLEAVKMSARPSRGPSTTDPRSWPTAIHCVNCASFQHLTRSQKCFYLPSSLPYTILFFLGGAPTRRRKIAKWIRYSASPTSKLGRQVVPCPLPTTTHSVL